MWIQNETIPFEKVNLLGTATDIGNTLHMEFCWKKMGYSLQRDWSFGDSHCEIQRSF